VRLVLDSDACQGHARCLALAPDLFDLDAAGYAVLRVATVPPELEADARNAAAACPERAITVAG
jgi:ferredoxin